MAESRNLEILNWLHSNGYPWDKDTCEAAAKNGQANVVLQVQTGHTALM